MNVKSILKLPENKQGIVIDIIVIALNLFLFSFFSERLTAFFSDAFAADAPDPGAMGTLLTILIVGRLGGLYLKRFPLQARMRSEGGAFSAYFLVFTAPIMILSGVGAAVAVQYFAAGLGWIPIGADGQPKESQTVSMIAVFGVLILAGFEIYLLFRLGRQLNAKEKLSASKGGLLYGKLAELVADFGLFAYMMVWQVVYYLVSEMLLSPPSGHRLETGTYIFGIFVVALCFGLFYLSPRAVFLTEDRKYPSTWLFILGAFISSLLPHWLQRITGIFF